MPPEEDAAVGIGAVMLLPDAALVVGTLAHGGVMVTFVASDPAVVSLTTTGV
jgi:hypothetical protein